MNPVILVFLGSQALAAALHPPEGPPMRWLPTQGHVHRSGGADPEEPVVGGHRRRGCSQMPQAHGSEEGTASSMSPIGVVTPKPSTRHCGDQTQAHGPLGGPGKLDKAGP